MKRHFGEVILLALTVGGLPSLLHAQGVHRELGVQGYALFTDTQRIGGGIYGALRDGSRVRFSLFAGADGSGAGTTGRVEGLAHLLLSPTRQRGMGFYCAGGLAVDLASGAEARMVGLIGVEGRPGARRGWVVEAGAGGGWRLVGGWRWRR